VTPIYCLQFDDHLESQSWTPTRRRRVGRVVFEAELQDVSRPDAPAEVLGRARIDPAGQPPFFFQIAYDDAAVLPGRRYVVRATVRHQGQLLFTTDRSYPLLRGGDSAPLRLLLVSTGAGRRPSQPAPREARLELTGMFAYMADAATITLCADSRRLPVAMEADYRALEAAYLKARTQPGQELLVSLEGGGCNRVMGSFELDGDKLRLRGMAGTMMACVAGMEQEQRFLKSLEKVERYRRQPPGHAGCDRRGGRTIRGGGVALEQEAT
jgi:putative lipoprotein